MTEQEEISTEDVDLFEAIHREEMGKVPNRKMTQSQVVSQKALAPAIVRFINHKLENKGTQNVTSNKRSSGKKG